jgi:hypothetical protein
MQWLSLPESSVNLHTASIHLPSGKAALWTLLDLIVGADTELASGHWRAATGCSA